MGNSTAAVDAKGLARALAREVRGEVRFDAGSRALYATDGSNYRQPPIGVVLPRDAEDVAATLGICRRFGAPVLSRGGGTSLAGQCCNTAVVMDFSRHMNAIVDLDPQRKIARVQPGVILDHLRGAAEKFHLTFAPDPATHTHNTLGGMIGNNSCGVHSVMGGRTSDNVMELEVLTYEGERMRVGETPDERLDEILQAGGRRGEIYGKLKQLRDRYGALIRERYPDIPRRVSGYNLDDLLPEKGFHVARALVGSEATCVSVVEAVVRLVDNPPARVLVVLGYPDVYRAGDHVPEVMAYGPVGCEGVDDRLVADMRKTGLKARSLPLLPEGRGWLLVEFGGESREEAEATAHRMMHALAKGREAPTMRLYADQEEQSRVWGIRESGLGATAHLPGQKDTWPGWEDSAVPPERVGEYLRKLRHLLDGHGLGCDLYGHFGQGCIHTRIDFDLKTAAGIANYRRFVERAADLVTSLGGSLSGEHGDGQSRAALLRRMYGDELMRAFREFKAIWDPHWKMNPGKVIDAYEIGDNLRLGTGYAPAEQKLHFKYPADHGSFSEATLRCVGVGKCRREEGGTMCPSYMVTREEMHSTRGRAHLLFEMLRGDLLTGGWRDKHVKESLELCLACKGCKGECPVNVDLATYKAEFMAHYYRRRLRPPAAYGFGYLDLWSRLAARAPGVVNTVTRTAGVKHLLRAVMGIHQGRPLPLYARQTFKAWFAARPVRNEGGPQVIVWPDTFNNHFQPRVLIAAVEVLEAAGHQVIVPGEHLCCGRPLYDWGLLRRASRLLKRNLEVLGPHIRAGVPVVGLEPACAATFRDELLGLFPNDEQAKRLSAQTYLLSEFLTQRAEAYQPPRLGHRAVLHGHCHHKAVMDFDSEQQLLDAMGMDCETLDSGCCGMAGNFGYERDKYDISIACGERVLLPAVREATAETLIIADGFSCREQISHNSNRIALHLAEVLRMGLESEKASSVASRGLNG